MRTGIDTQSAERIAGYILIRRMMKRIGAGEMGWGLLHSIKHDLVYEMTADETTMAINLTIALDLDREDGLLFPEAE